MEENNSSACSTKWVKDVTRLSNCEYKLNRIQENQITMYSRKKYNLIAIWRFDVRKMIFQMIQLNVIGL